MIPILAHSIENLTDARYFASWQADWIALTAEKDGQAVLDMSAIREIASWLDGSQLMLAFDQTPLEEAVWLGSEVGINTIMVPYQELREHPGAELFLRVSLDGAPDRAGDINTAFRHGAHVVITAAEWKEDYWQLLEEVLPTPFLRKKCFLDLPLTESLIRELDDRFPGIGFCLAGSQEERPGYKSFEEIDELIEVLRPWD